MSNLKNLFSEVHDWKNQAYGILSTLYDKETIKKLCKKYENVEPDPTDFKNEAVYYALLSLLGFMWIEANLPPPSKSSCSH